jgi:hypothetical protein
MNPSLKGMIERQDTMCYSLWRAIWTQPNLFYMHKFVTQGIRMGMMKKGIFGLASIQQIFQQYILAMLLKLY